MTNLPGRQVSKNQEARRFNDRTRSTVQKRWIWTAAAIAMFGIMLTNWGGASESAGLSASHEVSTFHVRVETSENNESDFERDIWPLFETYCNDCHSGETAESRFRTDARNAFFRGGVSGSPIDGQDVQQSRLLKHLTGADGFEQMPLDEEPLDDNDIDAIAKWIAEGADWPDGVGELVDISEHWAYVSPKRQSPVPAVESWGSYNAIDWFVQDKLVERGLSPSELADDATLVRRVYLDLIGLPPTRDQVQAYLADTRADRYERLVDRLLMSPHYGEKWARPWLDLSRYADSNGYQADQYREVWPYRDWVINAMNDDMSFRQFTLEQLAGDLLDEATESQRIATGFHRLTTCNVEAGVDPEENRVNQVIDRVNTTGTVWLGTSLECAQCHNHKYDPFTQQDYYSLFAFFNQTPLEVQDSGNNIQYEFVGPKLELSLTTAQARLRESTQHELDQLRQQRSMMIAQQQDEIAAWIVETAEHLRSQNDGWTLLPIDEFESKGGASSQELEDGSILVTGERPDKDEYVVDVVVRDLDALSSIRLETLTHESLPGNGPGRHDPERPNFVLYEFELSVEDEASNSSDWHQLSFGSATADFSQANWHVNGAIDGDPSTGWAINPQFHRDHAATFVLSEPLLIEDSVRLRFRFDQHYGGCRTIGRLRLLASERTLDASSIPDPIRTVLSKPAEAHSAGERKRLEEYYWSLQPAIRELDIEIAEVEKAIEAIQPASTLVMVEQDSMRETHVFVRGDFLNPSEQVIASTPRVLHKLDRSIESRVDLAEWLTDEANPLSARVFVNRWWASFFGSGIVRTLDDFGTQGDPPSHPELLDWLAIEYLESDGSMKHIHRLIVTSYTYRQSSIISERDLTEDPNNRWLARGARFRLPAETIRDVGLSVSGLRSNEIGGPPVYPPQPPNVWRHVGRNAPKYDTSNGNDRFRRGLYVVWRRSAPYPNFVNFDAPDRASCVVDRSRTNTPLQALTLLNDPAYLEMIDAFAERMLGETKGASVREKLTYAFEAVLSRQPLESEIGFLSTVLISETTLSAGAGEGERGQNSGSSDIESYSRDHQLSGWRFVATVLFNLDETISKE